MVEACAGEAVDASALREAIAAELGTRVLSPSEKEPAECVAMMTVAIAGKSPFALPVVGHFACKGTGGECTARLFDQVIFAG